MSSPSGEQPSSRVFRPINRMTEAVVALAEIAAQQETAAIEMAQLAMEDSLTGLPNRRALQRDYESLESDTRRHPETKETGSYFIIFDVDHFKQVNDTYGHDEGDQVLVGLATILTSRTRGTDTVARLGGEEFAVLLPHAPLTGVLRVAEDIREEVEATLVAGDKDRVTVSAGVCRINFGQPLEDNLKTADQALYEAKHSGRNRTILCTQEGLIQSADGLPVTEPARSPEMISAIERAQAVLSEQALTLEDAARYMRNKGRID